MGSFGALFHPILGVQVENTSLSFFVDHPIHFARFYKSMSLKSGPRSVKKATKNEVKKQSENHIEFMLLFGGFGSHLGVILESRIPKNRVQITCRILMDFRDRSGSTARGGRGLAGGLF